MVVFLDVFSIFLFTYLFYYFFKRKNLWITKRFLLWIFWSLTNKPARIHFGGQENSFWDLLHSLRCWLLRIKSCLESFASEIHLLLKYIYILLIFYLFIEFLEYMFVGVEGNVFLVCPSVPISMVYYSVSDHKNPLIDIFWKLYLAFVFY